MQRELYQANELEGGGEGVGGITGNVGETMLTQLVFLGCSVVHTIIQLYDINNCAKKLGAVAISTFP